MLDFIKIDLSCFFIKKIEYIFDKIQKMSVKKVIITNTFDTYQLIKYNLLVYNFNNDYHRIEVQFHLSNDKVYYICYGQYGRFRVGIYHYVGNYQYRYALNFIGYESSDEVNLFGITKLYARFYHYKYNFYTDKIWDITTNYIRSNHIKIKLKKYFSSRKLIKLKKTCSIL